MTRILILGVAGEQAAFAVADLVQRTGHDVTIGDLRVGRARDVLRRLGAPERVLPVDVDEPAELRRAMAGFDVVLNATLMRQITQVTDAAIDAGVALVDLGNYYPDALAQFERHDAAVRAGVRVVAGCGAAPGLTNVLARLGADALDRVHAIRLYSYLDHPLSTSPGIVITRFDAVTGTTVAWEGGRLVERPAPSGEERVTFPPPYGEQVVHLAPHPEPITIPRSIDVPNVTFKVAYPERELVLARVLVELGFDLDEPFEVDGVAISPQRFAAAYIGGRGVAPERRTASLKQVWVDGERDGHARSIVFDSCVEDVGRPASARITGTVAAIATAMVADGGGAVGVHAPEASLDAAAVVAELHARGYEIRRREVRLD